MLRVTLIGNCGNNPEVRFTPTGKEVVNLSVAVNQVRRNAAGERTENTEWFRIRLSGYQVDYAKKLTKGARVMVMGRLDISHYTSRDNEARTGFDVWADEIQGMGAREKGGDDDDDAERQPRSSPASAAGASAGGTDLEDLPFNHPRWLDEPWLYWRCP